MAENSVFKFVELIEKHPCLYNNMIADYSRKDVTEKAWQFISEELNWTVADCKEKWKNIRNGFVRSLKAPPSGSSSKAKKRYYLHDSMQFVLPFLRPIKNTNEGENIELNEEEAEVLVKIEEGEELIETPTISNTSSPTTRKKRKFSKKESNMVEVDETMTEYLEEEKNSRRPEDPRRMFLLSLLPDVSVLTDKNMRTFKMKTMSLLENLIETQEA